MAWEVSLTTELLPLGGGAAISIPLWSGIGAGEGKRSAVNQLYVSACLAGVREAAHDYTTTALQVVEKPVREMSVEP